MRQQIQTFGRTLSSMVMPNIGAFIAWGFITALFIPTGWCPNELLAQLVDPMVKYLLPLLIAYTGGRNTGGERGGVVAAIATTGIIVGSEIPMFIGAMLMGPLAGACVKRFDRFINGRIRAGFEMLINNFSVGIIGMLLAIAGYFAIGHLVTEITLWISAAVAWIMTLKLLPLVAIFIEPAKVLFLNNAINHGIFSPVGIEQAREMGESIMFLLETNPGPGLGVLLAYWFFGRGNARESAPGAIVIQFFGGIHEIYFPYILARPILILAPIAGSATAILFYSLTDAGLVAPASPGSVISVLAMAPKGKTLLVLAGIVISAVVSLLVASPLIRRRPDEAAEVQQPTNTSVSPTTAHKIVFACDAGMGSSALGATRFRNRLQAVGQTYTVINSAVDNIPSDADIVICQAVLAERAGKSAPQASLIVIGNFLTDPNLDTLFHNLTSNPSDHPTQPEILSRDNIIIGLASEDRIAAIRRAGEIMVNARYVNRDYIESMVQREELSTTYMGMGIAIPHGTSEAKAQIVHSGIVVLQYPDGVDFDGEKAHLIIGIAGVGDTHVEILANLAGTLENEDLIEKLTTTNNPEDIYNALK